MRKQKYCQIDQEDQVEEEDEKEIRACACMGECADVWNRGSGGSGGSGGGERRLKFELNMREQDRITRRGRWVLDVRFRETNELFDAVD